MIKRNIIFAIILLFTESLFSQVPDTLWSRIYSLSPDGDIDEGKCIIQTNDNGYIVTGSCVPEGMVSHIDLLLLRADIDGNILWVKNFGEEFVEEGLSVEQTVDGGFIVCGRLVTAEGVSPLTGIQSDIWLIKTDEQGNKLWSRTYGGAGNDYGTTVKETSDGGYIISGTLDSKFSYPPNCFLDCNEYYSSKGILLKTNSIGDTLWTATAPSGSYGLCVTQTKDNNYVLVGPLVSQNQMDIFLMKVDQDGNIIWTKLIGETNFIEYVRYVQALDDGYIILGHKGPLPVGYIDALMIKIDPDGNILWEKTIGGDKSDSGNSIQLTSDGGFFITGITNANFSIHHGDSWVFKTDSEGNLLWQRMFDITLNDFAWYGIITTDGSYVVTGLIGYGFGGDLWIAKIGQVPADIKKDSEITSEYALYQNYPNPFNPATTISYSIPESGYVSLKIYDTLGREIRELVNMYQSAGNYSVSLIAANFSSGVYFYRLKAGKSFFQTKKMQIIK